VEFKIVQRIAFKVECSGLKDSKKKIREDEGYIAFARNLASPLTALSTPRSLILDFQSKVAVYRVSTIIRHL